MWRNELSVIHLKCFTLWLNNWKVFTRLIWGSFNVGLWIWSLWSERGPPISLQSVGWTAAIHSRSRSVCPKQVCEWVAHRAASLTQFSPLTAKWVQDAKLRYGELLYLCRVNPPGLCFSGFSEWQFVFSLQQFMPRFLPITGHPSPYTQHDLITSLSSLGSAGQGSSPTVGFAGT